ncbi:hypothetical protein MHH52_13905 [Paenibacillus sp. FSL K6-0276]|uniref:hypothetical protein n=1 Tax=Paenibacillus sp. FSL K6-0276 TaxID=2921450 RepID=UPI0030EBFAFE
MNTDHAGYSATGFVDGYLTKATTPFTVNMPAAGSREVTSIYANASGSAKTISVYVNGTKILQSSLLNLANWD